MSGNPHPHTARSQVCGVNPLSPSEQLLHGGYYKGESPRPPQTQEGPTHARSLCKRAQAQGKTYKVLSDMLTPL